MSSDLLSALISSQDWAHADSQSQDTEALLSQIEQSQADQAELAGEARDEAEVESSELWAGRSEVTSGVTGYLGDSVVEDFRYRGAEARRDATARYSLLRYASSGRRPLYAREHYRHVIPQGHDPAATQSRNAAVQSIWYHRKLHADILQEQLASFNLPGAVEALSTIMTAHDRHHMSIDSTFLELWLTLLSRLEGAQQQAALDSQARASHSASHSSSLSASHSASESRSEARSQEARESEPLMALLDSVEENHEDLSLRMEQLYRTAFALPLTAVRNSHSDPSGQSMFHHSQALNHADSGDNTDSGGDVGGAGGVGAGDSGEGRELEGGMETGVSASDSAQEDGSTSAAIPSTRDRIKGTEDQAMIPAPAKQTKMKKRPKKSNASIDGQGATSTADGEGGVSATMQGREGGEGGQGGTGVAGSVVGASEDEGSYWRRQKTTGLAKAVAAWPWQLQLLELLRSNGRHEAALEECRNQSRGQLGLILSSRFAPPRPKLEPKPKVPKVRRKNKGKGKGNGKGKSDGKDEEDEQDRAGEGEGAREEEEEEEGEGDEKAEKKGKGKKGQGRKRKVQTDADEGAGGTPDTEAIPSASAALSAEMAAVSEAEANATANTEAKSGPASIAATEPTELEVQAKIVLGRRNFFQGCLACFCLADRLAKSELDRDKKLERRLGRKRNRERKDGQNLGDDDDDDEDDYDDYDDEDDEDGDGGEGLERDRGEDGQPLDPLDLRAADLRMLCRQGHLGAIVECVRRSLYGPHGLGGLHGNNQAVGLTDVAARSNHAPEGKEGKVLSSRKRKRKVMSVEEALTEEALECFQTAARLMPEDGAAVGWQAALRCGQEGADSTAFRGARDAIEGFIAADPDCVLARKHLVELLDAHPAHPAYHADAFTGRASSSSSTAASAFAFAPTSASTSALASISSGPELEPGSELRLNDWVKAISGWQEADPMSPAPAQRLQDLQSRGLIPHLSLSPSYAHRIDVLGGRPERWEQCLLAPPTPSSPHHLPPSHPLLRLVSEDYPQPTDDEATAPGVGDGREEEGEEEEGGGGGEEEDEGEIPAQDRSTQDVQKAWYALGRSLEAGAEQSCVLRACRRRLQPHRWWDEAYFALPREPLLSSFPSFLEFKGRVQCQRWHRNDLLAAAAKCAVAGQVLSADAPYCRAAVAFLLTASAVSTHSFHGLDGLDGLGGSGTRTSLRSFHRKIHKLLRRPSQATTRSSDDTGSSGTGSSSNSNGTGPSTSNVPRSGSLQFLADPDDDFWLRWDQAAAAVARSLLRHFGYPVKAFEAVLRALPGPVAPRPSEQCQDSSSASVPWLPPRDRDSKVIPDHLAADFETFMNRLHGVPATGPRLEPQASHASQGACAKDTTQQPIVPEALQPWTFPQ